MNDLLSVARRLIEYAKEPGISREKQQDLTVAAAVLATFNATLNAAAPTGNGETPPIPG